MLGYLPPIPDDASVRLRLGMILWGVMAYLGDRVKRAPDGYHPQHRLIPLALVNRMQAWLQARKRAIDALMDRIREGRMRPPRPYRARAVRADAAPAVRKEIPPQERLPRGFGWMRVLASEVWVQSRLLGPWLEEAEVKAAVLGCPQMVRLLSPLLNAVGEGKPAWFPVLPKRPRTSRAGLPRRRAAMPAETAPPEAAAAPPLPASNPAPAAWLGRGPGPCETLAQYRSPYEQPGGAHPPRPPATEPDIPHWQRLMFRRARDHG
jgi:hypothetical protein